VANDSNLTTNGGIMPTFVTTVWAAKTFGGEPIDAVKVHPEGTILYINSGKEELRIFVNDEADILNFKNLVLWAWEKYLREKGL
jgi:hypothetical protein